MKTPMMLTLGLIIGGYAAPAFSQALPRYDVDAYCDEVMEFGGGSMMIRNGCIEMEQTSYNQLKQIWGGLSARTRSYCDEVARFSGGGSYSTLDGCVEMETNAASAPSAFEY